MTVGSTLHELGLVCDLQRVPLDYPGPRAPSAGLLVDDRYVRVADGDTDAFDAVLARRGAAPVAARTAVVAVGSNASPSVLRRKFAAGAGGGAGGALVVPFVVARVRDLGVGHSAHVSVAGFVAAAPVAAPGTATDLVVSLLDDDQLRILDRTEPNYTRRPVPGAEGPCWVYDSHWGVIAPPAEAPIPLGTQADLLARLRAGWAPYAGAVGGATEAAAVLGRFAASEPLRRRVRALLASTGWARESGLAGADQR